MRTITTTESLVEIVPVMKVAENSHPKAMLSAKVFTVFMKLSLLGDGLDNSIGNDKSNTPHDNGPEQSALVRYSFLEP